MPPVAWIGSPIARTTLPSTSGGAMWARFSAIVLPVTVRQSPCSRPASSRARMTTGTPPTRSTSVMTYAPNGLTSARCGTLAPTREKSARVRSTSASWAMASRWSTAFVEPPKAMTTAIAFSNASLVMMSRAVMPWRSSSTTASPDLRANPSRRRSVAGGRGRAGQRHADRLGDRGHRVGGVHAAAGALAGADRALDGVDVLAATSGPRAQAPTASNASMIVTVRSEPSDILAMPGRIEPA